MSDDDPEAQVDVDFALGEDIRTESRLLQDAKWSSAVQDGRVHLSHREASLAYGRQFTKAIQHFTVVSLLLDLLEEGRSRVSKLCPELLRIIVDYAYAAHGPLVTAAVMSKQLNDSFSLRRHPSQNIQHQHLQQQLPFNIYIRKRPILSYERERNVYNVLTMERKTPHSVVLHDGKLSRNGRQLTMTHRNYLFSRCFDESFTNAEVCEVAILPLLQHVSSGNSATLLCYGQTGTGKTYTLQAVADYVANYFENANVSVIFFEIYRKKCFDLLNDKNIIHLRSDENDVVHARGARSVELISMKSKELADLIKGGLSLRASKSTERNYNSSRSHAICTIRIFDKSEGSITPDSKVFAKLNLVDLAGSERNYETTTMTAEEHRESADINFSLLSLKECFRTFNSELKKQRNFENDDLHRDGRHILSSIPQQSKMKQIHDKTAILREVEKKTKAPYRASLLTRVLKECFDLSSTHKTTIITTVSPTPIDLEHTLNSLEHVIMMDTFLQSTSWVNVVNLPINEDFVCRLPMEEWTYEHVREWLQTVEGGRFSQLVVPPGLTGKVLCNLNTSSLCALSAGVLRQARQDEEGEAWVEEGTTSNRQNAIGRALYKAIKTQQFNSIITVDILQETRHE